MGKAVVGVEIAGVSSHFRVHSAWLEVLPTGKTPVHLHLEGTRGALTLELPLVPAWLLSADMHECTIGSRRTTERTRPARKIPKNPDR